MGRAAAKLIDDQIPTARAPTRMDQAALLPGERVLDIGMRLW